MNIHQGVVLSRKRVATFGACLAVSGMLLSPSSQGIAQTVTLAHQGSTATVDLGSSAGMNSWTVDGQNQLDQQWFWYRTDNGVAKAINTIANPGILNGGLNYQQIGDNQLDVYYYNDQLAVEISYLLTGGGVGSGSADITEHISIFNLSDSALNLNFYQYSNFNLLGAANDNVEIFGSTGNYNYIRQWNGSTAIQEAVNAPSANYAEAGLYNTTLDRLNNNSNLQLNENLAAGPGNATWAFQWYATIASGDEFDLTKDKALSISVVPEPGTTALAMLGGLFLAGWTVRRRHS